MENRDLVHYFAAQEVFESDARAGREIAESDSLVFSLSLFFIVRAFTNQTQQKKKMKSQSSSVLPHNNQTSAEN